jgi:hypothetical protein
MEKFVSTLAGLLILASVLSTSVPMSTHAADTATMPALSWPHTITTDEATIVVYQPQAIAWQVVYLGLTDNSVVGEYGKVVLFHHRERGAHHGTELIVLPTPRGRSRIDLPHRSCRVARRAQRHTSDPPQAGHIPTQTLQSAQAFQRSHPQTAVRGL